MDPAAPTANVYNLARVDVGIYFFPTADGAPVADVARATEARGFDALFVPEHSHFPATATSFRDPATGELPERYRRILDPFVSLATAAAVTSRIRLGTAACILPIHDPILLAKTVATLDHLSGGRVDLGVGAGWNYEELRTHGVDPERRFDALREGIAALTTLWRDETAAFHGEIVSFDPVWMWPKPLQQPRPPVYVAAHGPGGARRALELGDGWLPSHRGGHDIKTLVRDVRAQAEDEDRPAPLVTFLAKTADAAGIEHALEAEVDRVLLPVSTGPLTVVVEELDRCAAVPT